MVKRMMTRLFLVVVVATFASAAPVGAAECGFPGAVGVGTFGGGTGYVVLFSVTAPFAFTGVGAAPLATPAGDACMDIWRDSTLGPAPPNFNAVWAAGPAPCAAATCSIVPTVCSPVTFCVAFP